MSTSTRVGIVGIGHTPLAAAHDDLQHVELISAAVAAALRGTGISMRDVEFVMDSGSDVLDGRSISNCGFLGAMGAHRKEESRIEDDGLWAALYGMLKIAGGSASVGLVVAYSKPSESDLKAFYSSQTDPFYQRPVGLDHRVAAGLQAQAYLDHHGLKEDVLTTAAVHDWQHALADPWVDTEGAPGATEISGSAMAANPLRELHLSRPVDGAVALLIASEDIARRAAERPVWITGAGAAMGQHTLAMRPRYEFADCATAAARALSRSGLTADAAGLVEVTAQSAAAELMVLEALGLAPAGRAIDLYDSGSDRINPSGGALPADPVMATGLVRLAAAATRLADEQATTAIVHAASGVGMQNHCVMTVEV